uniref:Uncharacterized protein n=1 Tax=Megaselia scalaris TaxID=36166 RepID=T1H2Y4_MEGSC
MMYPQMQLQALTNPVPLPEQLTGSVTNCNTSQVLMAAPMNSNSSSSRKLANVKSTEVQRTPSQATSIKAEPGSN